MTIKELKEHCKNIVRQTEMWAYMRRVEPQGRIYEEHKLVLELLNQELCDSRVKNELKNELAKDAISRDEVIDILHHAWESRMYIPECIREVKELPSVQPNPIECDDAISRKAVTRLFGREPFLSSNEAWYLRKINELPSVQPSRKGRWIDISNFVYECSNCGKRGMFRELFCPNCGCRMVEPQESEDKE